MVIEAPHDQGEAVATSEKVRFLSSPGTYPGRPMITVKETHMSWVFLAGGLVYKFKKPVRYPFLDFSTLRRRRYNCTLELKLNHRLAPRVYHRILPLRLTSGGELTLGDEGEPVEWLVEMERLPETDMLDRRLHAGTVTTHDVVAIGEKLGAFYARARPQRRGGAYLRNLMTEGAVNRKLLLRPGCPIRRDRAENLVGRVENLLRELAPAIASRVDNGWIVEGHGDLRPEHICLGEDPQIIDCLEFNRNMRVLDPYDEVNYLGLECAFKGADWIGSLLLDVLDRHLQHRPEPRLLATYGAFRAVLRARLCVAHLLDAVPMQPERWSREAERYLDFAETECTRAEG